MSAQPSQPDQSFMDYIEDERERGVRDALAALEAAEKEVAYIRVQLLEADRGRPYYRIGRVEGLDAAKVFAAFGAIERVACIGQDVAEGGQS